MKAIHVMNAGMVAAMITMIERDLEINTAPCEARRNNIEMLAMLRAREAQLDFESRQLGMFDDFFQLEQQSCNR